MLSGEVLFHVDGVAHRLKPGDGILIDSQLPHRAENAGRGQAHVLMTVARPAESSEVRRQDREGAAQGRKLEHFGRVGADSRDVDRIAESAHREREGRRQGCQRHRTPGGSD